MEKLPVWGTVKESFSFCFGNISTLVKLSLIPIALYVALILGKFYLYDAVLIDALMGNQEGLAELEFSVLPYIFQFVSVLVVLPVITAWHRNYLVSYETGEPTKIQFGSNEIRYLMYLILVFMLVIISIVAPISAGIWLITSETGPFFGFVSICLGTVLAIFISSRLTMVFPAAAIGAQAGLKDSWRATKGSVLRIIATQLLLGLIVIAVLLVVIGLVGAVITPMLMTGNMAAESLKTITLFSGLIYIPAEVLVTAIGVSCLSIIYKFLSTRDDRVEAESVVGSEKY
ncbi:hypothetical protein [Curvivirga aplysinae]|uniref:hypothetical protein n=1 Tax=Curvivirga aplysinae TaxID=2529852 RepID=UPI0012BB6D70|nr:hypothetical protein [Curvivirga aplysinae]MTI09527.1 hypothetical protein [Curvivirga aplysinae]